MQKDKRILIFNVNWLGDVLFTTPAIRNIRRNFPDSFIACIIPSRCYPILKGNPHLDEVIIFDEKDRHKNILAQLHFVKLLKGKKFDKVFLLHRSFTRALICRLAGIPERIGYHTKKRAFLLTKNIPSPKKDSTHRIDYYLNLLEQSGLAIEDRYPEFFIQDEDADFVESFLSKNSVEKKDFLAVLNPGGNWLPKRWPAGHWAQLADMLIKNLQVKTVITGAHNDAALVLGIEKAMHEKPVIACGKFNIKQLAALSRRADVFITADTGPMHIASASGAKNIIALFGPTDPAITGAYPAANVVILQKDVGCKIPCYEVHCKDNRCMKAIGAEEVAGVVKGIIAKKDK